MILFTSEARERVQREEREGEKREGEDKIGIPSFQDRRRDS